MGETNKAEARRHREGWHARYAPPDRTGIDIGCERDPLNHTFWRWDQIFGDGDAAEMAGVPSGIFHTVYASHILEHLVDPVRALRRWYELVEDGGHLIVCVPHRDLYEKRKRLPSLFNPDHKTLWLPYVSAPPDTLCLADEIDKAIPGAHVAVYRVLSEGYDYSITDPNTHAQGEYSIEAVIRKRAL